MYRVEDDKEWDTELSFALTADKSIISSREAKEICRRLNAAAALPLFKHHYDWAMLCIGYCFAKGLTERPDGLSAAPDANGAEIPAFKTCFQEAHYRLWLVVLSDVLFRRNPDRKAEKSDLYRLIQDLWHTGAVELERHWQKCREFHADDELAARQLFLNELAGLAVKNAGVSSSQPYPETFATTGGGAETDEVVGLPEKDLSKKITQTLQSMGKGVRRSEFVKSGLRYDFYLLQFSEYSDWDKLHAPFCSAMGIGDSSVMVERKEGLPHAYTLKVKRPEQTWQSLSKERFFQALQAYRGRHLIPLCVGADETGQAVFEDLHEGLHIIVGGMTGSGKSVMVRTLLYSLFELSKPDKITVAILDPANDYAVFKDRPNLWGGAIQGCCDEMCGILEEFVEEMERREMLLQKHEVEHFCELPEAVRPPYLVVVVEEVAALLASDKNAEKPLEQLARKARKTGIHLIMATQELDADTFSKQFRKNIPSGIAMKVRTAESSVMILGQGHRGAVNLLGKGDHLVRWNGGEPYFLHGFNV